MRALIGSLVALAVACGGSEQGTETACDVDGITVTADMPVDCGKVAQNVATAKQLLGATTAELQGLKLTIRAADDLGCQTRGVAGLCVSFVWGLYHYSPEGNEIESHCSMRILGHELLHHLGNVRGNGADDSHEHWNHEVDNQFRKAAVSVCQ